MSIRRIDVGERMSQAVVHGNIVYTAGQVARSNPDGGVADQTREVLDRIDALLSEAGTDKSKLLSAHLWITTMENFAEMNAVWDGWVAPGNTPCRACVEAKLASDKYDVEIMVTAAR